MCREKLTKKIEVNPNSLTRLSEAERYEMLELAKDEVLNLVYSMKRFWGYETWVTLTGLIRCGCYEDIREVVAPRRDTLTKKLLLDYLDDIKALEGGEN